MAGNGVPEWDPEDKTPYVYARLADHIQARITAGDYAAGDMLPNEREMVPEYGVSIDSVRRALAELRTRGIVVTYPSRGTYVAAPPAELARAPPAGVAGGSPVARGSLLPRATAGHPLPMRCIDRASRVPPHQQIANCLRAEIMAGKYSPDGPPVPGVTRITQEWGVARKTAMKALRLLAGEGLIEVEPGMGYYVKRA